VVRRSKKERQWPYPEPIDRSWWYKIFVGPIFWLIALFFSLG
jgi:hypothetical protein